MLDDKGSKGKGVLECSQISLASPAPNLPSPPQDVPKDLLATQNERFDEIERRRRETEAKLRNDWAFRENHHIFVFSTRRRSFFARWRWRRSHAPRLAVVLNPEALSPADHNLLVSSQAPPSLVQRYPGPYFPLVPLAPFYSLPELDGLSPAQAADWLRFYRRKVPEDERARREALRRALRGEDW